jgi:hypothetical protein
MAASAPVILGEGQAIVELELAPAP